MSITGDQIETKKGAGLQQPALRSYQTEFPASDSAHLSPNVWVVQAVELLHHPTQAGKQIFNHTQLLSVG